MSRTYDDAITTFVGTHWRLDAKSKYRYANMVIVLCLRIDSGVTLSMVYVWDHYYRIISCATLLFMYTKTK